MSLNILFVPSSSWLNCKTLCSQKRFDAGLVCLICISWCLMCLKWDQSVVVCLEFVSLENIKDMNEGQESSKTLSCICIIDFLIPILNEKVVKQHKSYIFFKRKTLWCRMKGLVCFSLFTCLLSLIFIKCWCKCTRFRYKWNIEMPLFLFLLVVMMIAVSLFFMRWWIKSIFAGSGLDPFESFKTKKW